MLAFNFFGATEGGLFDINATLPLMAIQVVALTYILNSLFFKPVGNVVEKREKFVSNNIIEAKNKLSEVKKLEADLLTQSDKLYKEALELANNEANASKEKARLEIESQTSAARDQLSKQADDLSELIVNRLILKK